MSSSIKKIKVCRFDNHGLYDLLLLEIEGNKKLRQYSSRRTSGLTEKESANKIANDFAEDYKSEYYKEKIIQGFQQLRLRYVTGKTFDAMDISIL